MEPPRLREHPCLREHHQQRWSPVYLVDSPTGCGRGGNDLVTEFTCSLLLSGPQQPRIILSSYSLLLSAHTCVIILLVLIFCLDSVPIMKTLKINLVPRLSTWGELISSPDYQRCATWKRRAAWFFPPSACSQAPTASAWTAPADPSGLPQRVTRTYG